jgi:hypothetical protein
MAIQTSTDYDVDNRYHGMGRAVDDTSGKRFLSKYVDQNKAAAKSTFTEDSKEDGRFLFSAPGWGTEYSFKNAFNSPRSPNQRRTEAIAATAQ